LTISGTPLGARSGGSGPEADDAFHPIDAVKSATRDPKSAAHAPFSGNVGEKNLSSGEKSASDDEKSPTRAPKICDDAPF
jgi:hypothetical protein